MKDDGLTFNFTIIKIGRDPRLFRLFRILRMIKILRVFSKMHYLKEYFGRFNSNLGFIRMIKVLLLEFFMVHLMACLWFMSATFEENIYDTCVGGRNIVDKEPIY